MDFKSFWATMKYSIHIRRSLDSFLSYSIKQKYNVYFEQDSKPDEYDFSNERKEVKEMNKCLSDITRMVLSIYVRMVFSKEENWDLS